MKKTNPSILIWKNVGGFELSVRCLSVEMSKAIVTMFQLEDTLRIVESNHNPTLALNYDPKNLI